MLSSVFSFSLASSTHLKTITPIRLPINHIQHLLLHLASHRIPLRPIVARTAALLVQEDILGIVYVLVRPRQNAADHARLEVEEDGARDVARVVGLVEEDIFAVADLGCEGLEVAVAVDAVFQAELLPELRADCTQALLVVSH